MAETLGKYEIRGILGKGAMGTVYDARDPIIDRRVAIKTITLPDAHDAEAQEELARFKREAQAAGRLSHPNIVGVFDYAETDKIAYIVQEFVDGPSLKGLLEKNERFPVSETVRVMEEMLAGLQFSHERGVVHRDIKPANIMLTKNGQVKIADFGIARIESSSMTQAGTIMGTPAYMSPEQFMGQTVDARTDIYSSGVMLYQMLTGERPFEGSMTAIMHKALNTTPPKPSELSVTTPAAFDAVVARAMAKRPEQRFASAAEFSQALRAALTGGPAAPSPEDSEATMLAAPRAAAPSPAPSPRQSPPPAAKSKMPLIAGVAVAVLAIGGGGAFFLLGGPPKPIQTATAPIAPTLPPAIALPPSTPLPPPPAPAPDTTATAPVPVPTPAPVPAPAPPPQIAAPAPTPPAPAPVPVAPPAPAVPNLAAMRASIASGLGSVDCALVGGDITDPGNVTLSGVTSHANEALLRRVITGAVPDANITWRVGTFDAPYCDALTTVRSIGPHFGPTTADLDVVLKGPARKLLDNENIVPHIQMPDFAGYLTVSYFSNDGTLAHMHPTDGERGLDILGTDGRTQHLKVTRAEANRSFPARAAITIGDPETCRCKPEEVGFQIGPPFGTDMILVIASSQPLFTQARPAEDTPAAYLHDLQTAIDQAHRRGVRLSARAIAVDTQGR